MSIIATLDEHLKTAMRARQADRVACIRQIRSKVQEAQNVSSFAGEVNDALYQQVIGSYIKSLDKAIGEMAQGGERSLPIVASYRAEIAYLQQFLPKLLDEASTRPLVAQAIAALSAKDAKEVGRVMGSVLKSHKGEVDPQLVKRLAGELLAG